MVDIFSQTKCHAVDTLVTTKRVLDDSDGSGDEKVKLKLHRKRPQKILNLKYSSNQTSCRLGPVGISKFAVVLCSLNQQCDDGTFIKDPSKWARFTEVIKIFDNSAVFDIGGDPLSYHEMVS